MESCLKKTVWFSLTPLIASIVVTFVMAPVASVSIEKAGQTQRNPKKKTMTRTGRKNR
jgi:multisubunit Na+/H+ antiporter MnhG subunit